MNKKLILGILLSIFAVSTYAQEWFVPQLSLQYPSRGGTVFVVHNDTPYQFYCEAQAQDGSYVDFFVYGGTPSQPYIFYSAFVIHCRYA